MANKIARTCYNNLQKDFLNSSAIIPMPQPTLSPETTTADTITIDVKPRHIPQTHTEDLGPISDTSPESWQYRPETINKYYSQKLPQVIGRLINVFLLFSRFALGLWWDKVRGKNPKEERKRAIHLREMLTELGPTYIKVGQALSTRPDLVPPVYLDELTTLQDQLPSFPNEVAYQFIEEELGQNPQSIYAELSEKTYRCCLIRTSL